jgi:hypothetical protein
MPSSWMLHRVALIRTYVSEERITSIISLSRMGELGKLAVSSSRRRLRRNTTLLGILYSKFYVQYIVCLRSVRRFLDTSNVVPSSPILVALMMEALSSSETSVTSQKAVFFIVTAVNTSNLT